VKVLLVRITDAGQQQEEEEEEVQRPVGLQRQSTSLQVSRKRRPGVQLPLLRRIPPTRLLRMRAPLPRAEERIAPLAC
jgi:hypothetical protein